MDTKAYIESGILELYVAGQLSEPENREVYELILKHPEILQEVLEIESAIVKLTKTVAPKSSESSLTSIKQKLNFGEDEVKVVSIEKTKNSWLNYVGWAAAILFGAGLLWTINQNDQLESEVTNINIEKNFLETQMEDTKSE